MQIIAEIAQAHDGSLGTAHAYIDAVAKSGADGIKFQTHIADAESTPSEPWRVKFSLQDETRFDYWKRMEFKEEWWHGLKKHCDEKGLIFISSAFSMAAVELLTRVGTAVWKIASGETNNLPMLDKMAQTGIPFWISTGMSPYSEIDAAIHALKPYGVPITILQCTSMYPTPPEKVGLNIIKDFRMRYPDCGVGLSDHSGIIYAGLAAASLGIDVLEVHVTLSKQAFGPDVPASLSLEELKQLVEGVRLIERMIANPVDKDAVAADLSEMRKLFNKSVVTLSALPAGTVLTAHNLGVKKPGIGIPASELDNLISRKLVRDVPANHFISNEDLA